jgi:hypothetical protein
LELDGRSPGHTLSKGLFQEYKHEAAEHRRILFERGSGLSPAWKDFRVFLQDLGPAPSNEHLATRLMAGDLTYAPGRVAWIHKSFQQAPVNPLSKIPMKTGEGYSQWLEVQGRMIEFTDLAKALGVPFGAMAVALKSGVTPDQLLQQASIAETLSQSPSPWLSDERRDSFMVGYRMWHMQILPHYASEGTPSFLFIFGALPNMLKIKQQLIEIGLWDPPTQKGKEQRQNHDLWRRYCENMARIESARVDIAALRQYSLATQIEEMWEHVKKLERRFRTNER